MEREHPAADKHELAAWKEQLHTVHPAELGRHLPHLPPATQVILFRLLEKDYALKVFEQLEPSHQGELLTQFTEPRANELVTELEPDDRVRLFDELPAKVAKRLLVALSPEERKITSSLMGYPPNSAGRIMTPRYVSVKQDMTVTEALEALRAKAEEAETLHLVYVVDQTRRLQGVVSLPELVLANGDVLIEDLMEEQVTRAKTGADQEDVAHLLQDQDLLALPVVDSEDRLVGIITFDDAMDVIQEETTEDIFYRVGLVELRENETIKSEQLLGPSLWGVWRVRLPFLVITLGGGLLAGAVIGVFEEVLESIAVVSIFIPVIMDMGGNVGTQSSTIFTRALLLDHIDTRRFNQHWVREVRNGFSMGLVLGTAGGFIAYLWQGLPGLGWAVGLSLVITITLATALGFLVPFILFKIGVDQAAGADPIITTIKDVSGLAIYFFSVTIFLAYLL